MLGTIEVGYFTRKEYSGYKGLLRGNSNEQTTKIGELIESTVKSMLYYDEMRLFLLDDKIHDIASLGISAMQAFTGVRLKNRYRIKTMYNLDEFPSMDIVGSKNLTFVIYPLVTADEIKYIGNNSRYASARDKFAAMILRNSISLGVIAALNELGHDSLLPAGTFLADGLSMAMPDIMALALGGAYSRLSGLSEFSIREIKAVLSKPEMTELPEHMHYDTTDSDAEAMQLLENSIYSYLYFMMLYSTSHDPKVLFESCIALGANKTSFKEFSRKFARFYEYTKIKYLTSRSAKLRQ